MIKIAFNKQIIDRCDSKIDFRVTAKAGIDYPPMKLLDLAFWLSSSKEFQASVRV